MPIDPTRPADDRRLLDQASREGYARYVNEDGIAERPRRRVVKALLKRLRRKSEPSQ